MKLSEIVEKIKAVDRNHQQNKKIKKLIEFCKTEYSKTAFKYPGDQVLIDSVISFVKIGVDIDKSIDFTKSATIGILRLLKIKQALGKNTNNQ